ncbi:MAG: hypothetical protein AAGD92_14270 [Pseudomonadota bacterium]
MKRSATAAVCAVFLTGALLAPVIAKAQQERSRGAEIERTEQLDRDLKKAKKQNKKGEQQREKGSKQLRTAAEKIEEGRKLINASLMDVRKERTLYASVAATIGDAATLEEFREEIKSLRAIEGRWSDAVERAARGQRLIADGEREQKKGEKNLKLGGRNVESAAGSIGAIEAEIAADVDADLADSNRD